MVEFNPSPGDEITIAGVTYRVSPHPAVPTFAFGQEGRKAFVYQLAHTKRRKLYALKKFKEAFRFSELSDICVALGQFAHLPGMGVCRRDCLIGTDYDGFLAEFPDLQYAVLMPWMHGSTWYDLVVGETPLDEESSLQMAWKTSQVLAALEDAGVAHCDIAGPNVIIDMDAGLVHLVDVEDMYAPGMPHPKAVPAGTNGYNHLIASAGLWYPEADRFAGAVLLAEMLGWHNPAVRDQSDEEHYFAVHEMQQDSEAYRLLTGTLYDIAPALADLFERAWFSPALEDCPPLVEWEQVLDPLARPSPVTEWVPLSTAPTPAAPHPGNWDYSGAASPVSVPEPAPVSAPPSVVDLPEPEDLFAPEDPDAPTVVSTNTQPILPPEPETDGPLVGFRPLDLSSLPQPEAPTAESTRPIEASPVPEAVPAETPSQHIQPEPEPSHLDGDAPQEEVPVKAEEGDAQAPLDEPLSDPMPVDEFGLTLPRLQLPRFLRRREPDAPALPPPVDDAPSVAEEGDDTSLVIAPPGPPHLEMREDEDHLGYILFWDPVPDATHYVLQESTRMAFSDGKQASVRQTEWHVPHRPPGTYYYRIRAHTEDDQSDWSNIVYRENEAENP